MRLTIPRVHFSGKQSKDGEHKQESAGNLKYVDKTDYGTIKNFPLIDQSIIQCHCYHKVPQLQILNKLKLDSTCVA
jgi:hypothetical protein